MVGRDGMVGLVNHAVVCSKLLSWAPDKLSYVPVSDCLKPQSCFGWQMMLAIVTHIFVLVCLADKCRNLCCQISGILVKAFGW